MSDWQDELWPVSELLRRLWLSPPHFHPSHPSVTPRPSPAGPTGGVGSSTA